MSRNRAGALTHAIIGQRGNGAILADTADVDRATSTAEPKQAAVSAGLRYVTDRSAGIRRKRSGTGFSYVDADGKTIRDAHVLKRIRSLAIPPAWTDVWICANPSGHLQATGRDARGRKQYRYHPRWREVRDEAKYDRLPAFAAALPMIRRRVARDLGESPLSFNKVVAAVVSLLEKTLIRVGNEEYARSNRSFGLTTLESAHAKINGSTLRFRFRGKSGKFHDIALSDARLARIVRRCQELPGRHLFQYTDDDGTVHDVGSADVNDYLRDTTGQDFTAKDFRTWSGTVLAAQALYAMSTASSITAAKQNVVSAIDQVAEALGNTRAVCRKCYVHPVVLDRYVDGALLDLPARAMARGPRPTGTGLSAAEKAVVALLQRKPRKTAERKTA
jgi:DNA topoisomerase-1